MELNNCDAINEVEKVFELYEEALVTNDVKTLNQFFYNHEETVRFGASENLFGYKAIYEFRKKRSDKNLARYLTRTTISTFERNFATVTTLFHRKNMPTGRQSQTWVKLADGWKIVSAHVSYLHNHEK